MKEQHDSGPKARQVDTKSLKLELEAGTYLYCACGDSADGVFCDDPACDNGFDPISFTLDAAKKVSLCMCRLSESKPFCDGSHRQIA